MDKLTRRKYFLQYFERCEDCFQFLHIHLFSPGKNNLVTADKQNKRLTKTVLQVVIDVEILADRLFFHDISTTTKSVQSCKSNDPLVIQIIAS